METFLRVFLSFLGCFLLTEGMTTVMPDQGVGRGNPPGRVKDRKDAMAYLDYFNHMGEDGKMETDEDMEAGLKDFQIMANIPQTGKLDNKTMTMLNMPRCGVKDNMRMSVKESKKANGRMKRYQTYVGWSQTDLTWRVTAPSRLQSLSESKIEEIMERALKVWADVTPLRFHQVTDLTTPVDFDITFDTFSHGDGNPFDGREGVLAHAYFPPSNGNSIPGSIEGDAHFDDHEYFTENTNSGTNLFQVAAHEFGHSLGLDHSEVADALMAPFYREYQPDFKLHQDDIDGIQQLYGKNVDVPDVTMEPMDPMEPDGSGTGSNCQNFDFSLGLDAVVSIPTEINENGVVTKASVFLFKGTQIWEVVESVGEERMLLEGYPELISDVFPGLPNNIDAAVNYYGTTFFFKGRRYFEFDGHTLVDSGRIANKFAGLPNRLDAAFIWSGNGRWYFVKGNKYYRYTYDDKVDDGYPKSLSVWTDDIVPAFNASFRSYVYRRTYFFYKEKVFIFNDVDFAIDSVRNLGMDWFGCKSSAYVAQEDSGNGALTTAVPSIVLMLISVVLSKAWLHACALN